MKKIAIVSSSVRTGRLSHRISLFLQDYITRQEGAEAVILDLKEYDFPLFDERLAYQKNPSPRVLDFAGKFMEADGLVIVSPVYNGSFPAALKNVIDLFYKEWIHKPVAVVSVTYGPVPGIGTVQQLQSLLLKLGARVAAPLYTVIHAGTEFSEEGIPADRGQAERYAAPAVQELLWLVDKSAE